jgi:hypothetical protein
LLIQGDCKGRFELYMIKVEMLCLRLLTIFQCNDLCHTLFKVTTHHHNRLYLVQIFPEDKRGSYIQRRLSYLFLQDMFDVGRDTDIQDFKVILTILKIQIIWNFIWFFFFNRTHVVFCDYF